MEHKTWVVLHMWYTYVYHTHSYITHIYSSSHVIDLEDSCLKTRKVEFFKFNSLRFSVSAEVWFCVRWWRFCMYMYVYIDKVIEFHLWSELCAYMCGYDAHRKLWHIIFGLNCLYIYIVQTNLLTIKHYIFMFNSWIFSVLAEVWFCVR